MTCIKVVLIYTINPLPCMFYLCLLSANLSLSFSPSHQVTLVSGVWQPRCRCSPVRNRASEPTVKNSEITNCGTLQHWGVYAFHTFHQRFLSRRSFLKVKDLTGFAKCKWNMQLATYSFIVQINMFLKEEKMVCWWCQRPCVQSNSH